MITHPYDLLKFPFRQAIQELLEFDDLEHLHLQPGAPDGIVVPGKDNHTPWHKKFYERIKGSTFEKLYSQFLQEFVLRVFGETVVAQQQCTFRIHWNGNLSVGAFHRDSDYHHNPEEVNFWIPVTEAFGTNTIWLESERDKGDFHPERVNYGQALQFRGGDLCHGNKVNDTEITRVSFDLRVIPFSKYIEPAEPKVGLGFGLRKFCIGGYYKLVEPQPA